MPRTLQYRTIGQQRNTNRFGYGGHGGQFPRNYQTAIPKRIQALDRYAVEDAMMDARREIAQEAAERDADEYLHENRDSMLRWTIPSLTPRKESRYSFAR
jgi:hypothetical protein